MRPRGGNGICYGGGVAAFPLRQRQQHGTSKYIDNKRILLLSIYLEVPWTAAKPTVTLPIIQYSLESNLHRTQPPLLNLTDSGIV